MIMRCISPSSGSSAFQTPPDLSPRQAISSPDTMGRGECDSPAANGQCSSGETNPLGVLPHLPSLPAEDSYEEAEPISPEGHMSPGNQLHYTPSFPKRGGSSWQDISAAACVHKLPLMWLCHACHPGPISCNVCTWDPPSNICAMPSAHLHRAPLPLAASLLQHPPCLWHASCMLCRLFHLGHVGIDCKLSKPRSAPCMAPSSSGMVCFPLQAQRPLALLGRPLADRQLHSRQALAQRHPYALGSGRRGHRQQPLRVIRRGRGLREGPCALHPVATCRWHRRGSCSPRGPALRLPLEETLARAVGQAALHCPGTRPAVLQVCQGPAASAGAGPARLPRCLQGQAQQEDAARAEDHGGGGRDAGDGLPEPPAGRGLEEGLEVIEEVSSSPLSRPSAHSSPVLPSSEQGRNSHQVRGSQLGSDSDEENSQISPAAASCIPRKGGFLDVLLNNQWQKLWCRVEQGALRMFRDPSCTESPEYAVPLAGSNVTPGADVGRRHHIHISQQGREVAVLQTHSDEERDIWLKILQVEKGAEPASVYETSVPGDGPSSVPVGGLLLRRFPTPNTYMDDPFGQLTPATHPSPVYSNADILHQLQQSLDRATQDQTQRLPCSLPDSAFSNPQSRAPEETAAPPASPGKSLNKQWVEVAPELKSRDFFQSQRTLMQPARKGAPDSLDFLIGKRAFPKLEEKVGQLERACRMKTRLKAGSEMNLLAIGKSLKGHIATATSSAGSEGSFLTPLLKRTTSTKSALRRAPSVVIIEKGKVLQKRKEWEMKSAM
ncbi:actin filament-associated protein 1-like isoform X2 [Mauremys mutica]|nr:actin filament-associated protein 1-like isoform X2 [Mauremys mutica]XP_044862986.1 actin filament-associated protein 1-like isoform X2 [Mauremys mutica]